MNLRAPIALTSEEMPVAWPRVPAASSGRDFLLLVGAQAAAREAITRDQVDVGARDLRKLFGKEIVERKAERDGSEHFGLGEFRGLRGDESQFAVDRHDVAARFAGSGAANGGLQRCRHVVPLRPSRRRQWASVRRRDDGKLRVEALPVALGHLGERRDVVRDDRIDHHRAEAGKLGDEACLPCREFGALVDQPVERRPRTLERVRGAVNGAAGRDARRGNHDGRDRQRHEQKDACGDPGFHPVVPADLVR